MIFPNSSQFIQVPGSVVKTELIQNCGHKHLLIFNIKNFVQVGYGITVFLAQSVNLMVVMEMMPQGGMSILGIFLAVSILLIGKL